MLLNGFSKSLLTLSFTLAIGFSSLPAHPASACKGLDESSCKQSQSCTWVSGYTTKNGNTVAAYCRNSGSKAKQGMNVKEEKGMQSGAIDSAVIGAKKIAKIVEEKNG